MLVSAPTNKASISVVCSRFLRLLEQQQQQVDDDDDDYRYCNAVLIGVEGKLVASQANGNSSTSTDDKMVFLSSLEVLLINRCFVFTWVTSLVKDLESLYHRLETINEEEVDYEDTSTRKQARQLRRRLHSSLLSLASKSGARYSATACVDPFDQKNILGANQFLKQ